MRSDYIKKYSVKIQYNFEGSGVLLKADENHCYLFTAKHNFKDNKNNVHSKIVVKNIKLKSILVTREDGLNITLKEKVYDYDDLIVFLIDGRVEDLESVQVLKGKATDEMDYFFYGYPAFKPQGHFLNKLSSRNEMNEYLFEVRNNEETKQQYAKGFSGSGLFTEDENHVNYLSGIVLQYDDRYHTVTNFNLSTIIDKINDALKSQKFPLIPIKKSNFHIQDMYGMYSWIVHNHSDIFLSQKVKEIFGEEHDYEDLIKPPLKRLNKYMDSTNQFEILEEKYTEKLADMYLLGAFIASKYQDKEEAINYLNKARKFRPNYVLFLTEIDEENSKEELFKAGKLAYIEEEYSFSYDCFKKILLLKNEKFEKIIIYEYLVKISKVIYRKEKVIIYYEELLNLYADDFQKATVFYELSLLETKEKSEYYARAGLLLVKFSSYLEITYLLYKRLYELTEDKEVDLLLRDVLENLVKVKVEYKYELSTLRYSETLNTIGWLSYFSIMTIMILGLSLGSLFEFYSLNILFMAISVLPTTIVLPFITKMKKSQRIVNKIIILVSFSVIFIQIYY